MQGTRPRLCNVRVLRFHKSKLRNPSSTRPSWRMERIGHHSDRHEVSRYPLIPSDAGDHWKRMLRRSILPASDPQHLSAINAMAGPWIWRSTRGQFVGRLARSSKQTNSLTLYIKYRLATGPGFAW